MGSLYKLLPSLQRGDIRLLSLLPGKCETDHLRCTLNTYELATAPVFESLSYCWGDATHKRPIETNEQEFMVTKNLCSALQHLRHGTKPRLLWLDAICINQTDKAECSD